MAARIYITAGTVSIGTGDTQFTGIGTQFGGADLEGAELWIHPVSGAHFSVGHVKAKEPRYPDEAWPHLGPIELVKPWRGAPVVEQPFVLVLSAAAVPSSLATAVFGRFVSFLERGAALFLDGRDTPASEVTENLSRALWYDPVARLLRVWSGGQFRSVDVVGAPFNSRGPWDRRPTEKTALSISAGAVAINASTGALDQQGVRHFSLEVDDDAEFQAPTNVVVGSRLLTRVTIDGGPHAITFAEAFNPDPGFTVEPGDEAVSLLLMEVVAETAGTATEVTLSRFPYAKNDLVSRAGKVYVSNVDLNTVDPLFETQTEQSNNWTEQPAVIGDRGRDGLGGFAYEFDDSTAMDSDPDPGDFRINNVDLALVNSINFALVDSDGINRADEFESYAIGDRVSINVRDGDAVFGAFRITAPVAITSARAVFAVSLVDKMAQLTDGEELDVVFRERGPEGAVGTDPGVLFNWDDSTSVGDPGAGKVAGDHVDLESVTVLSVSKENREAHDVAPFLAGLASSTNARKGSITLTKPGSDAQAIYALSGVSVEADHVELAVAFEGGAGGFVEGPISFQFERTGNDAIVVGDVSSVNGQTGDVVLEANDINTTTAGAFSGADIESVLEDLDAAAVDADARLDALEGTTIPAIAAQLNRAVRVRVVATTNINISTGMDNGKSVGGVTLATGNFVLLAGQTDPKQNGIYTVAASGAASRTTGYTAFAAFMGLLIRVDAGTGVGQLWTSTSAAGGTIGSDNLVFAKLGGMDVSALMALVAGSAASESGGDITYNADSGNVLYRTLTMTANGRLLAPTNMPTGATIEFYVDPTGFSGSPSVSTADTATTEIAADGATHAVNMPSNLQKGDGILVMEAIDGQPVMSIDLTASGGNWYGIARDQNSTIITGQPFFKEAEGGGADALTLTSSASEQSSLIAYRILNYDRLKPPEAAITNGNSTNSDPPTLTFLDGASIPRLIVAMRAGDAQVQATAAPSGYTLHPTTPPAVTNAAGAAIAAAFLQTTTSSENPGVFTSAAEQWVAATIGFSRGVYRLTFESGKFRGPLPVINKKALLTIKKFGTDDFGIVGVMEFD